MFFSVRKIALLVAAVCSFLPLATIFSQSYDNIEKTRIVPGVIIVNFHSGVIDETLIKRKNNGIISTSIPSIDKLNEKYAVFEMVKEFVGEIPLSEGVHGVDLSGYYVLRFPEDIDIEEILDAYNNDPNVEHTEPDVLCRLTETPNDPRFAQQWGLSKILAPQGWDVTHGDTTILIGVVDGGVDWQHQDLGGSVSSNYTDGNIYINWYEYNGIPGIDDDGNFFIDDIRGWDFVNVWNVGAWPGEDTLNPDNDPMDYGGHGTHVAGIACASTNNNIGVAGVGWECKILPLRAGFLANNGNGLISLQYAAQAIHYATMMGVKVVNCSWESDNAGGLGAAVDRAISQGVVVVVAAGNRNTDNPGSDKNYLSLRGNCITVAATDSTDLKATYSNYGAWVDCCAPGGDTVNGDSIHSTYHRPPAGVYHHYGNMVGTSMAAPFVSGLAALLKTTHPYWLPSDIKNQIMATADSIDQYNPGYAGLLGAGRINMYKALSSGTFVGGDINTNTVWQKILSPYIVTSTIRVRNGATLTIEPGVVVKFENGTGMVVGPDENYGQGRLTAEGTVTDSIVFTSASGSAGDWKGILFDQRSDDLGTCQLNYCVIEKAGELDIYSIGTNVHSRNNGTGLYIQNSSIRNCGHYGMYFDNSSPTLIKSQVINNFDYGIYNNTNSRPLIGTVLNNACDLYGNGTYEFYNNAADSVNARYNYWGTLDSLTIANRIYDHYDDNTRGIVHFNPYTDSTHTTAKPYSAVYAKWRGELAESAVIYVDSGNGWEQVDTTGPGGSPVYVILHHLDKLKATKKIFTKKAVKGGHEAVDSTMFELWVDSDTMDRDGSYFSVVVEDDEPKNSYTLNMQHPIFKYNLVVCIEWNGVNNEFYNKLETGFKRASSYLYNVTDGQTMLNKIAIYAYDPLHWTFCDVRILNSSPWYKKEGFAWPFGILFWRGHDYHIFLPDYFFESFPWKDWPDSPFYYKTIIHEFGHYAFGFHDEYKNGHNLEWDEYPGYNWNPGGPEHPRNYGLMQKQSSSTEMSSKNDYLREYNFSNLDPQEVSMQLWWTHENLEGRSGQPWMSCWDLFEFIHLDTSFHNCRSLINISKPDYGYYPNGFIYDREGPNEQWVEDSTEVIDKRTSTGLLASNHSVSVSAEGRPVSAVHIHAIAPKKRIFLGKTQIDGSLSWSGTTIGYELVAYKVINRKMLKFSLPITTEADIYSLDLTEQLEWKQKKASDAGGPGVVLDAGVSSAGEMLTLDLLLVLDVPLLQAPTGVIFYADTTDSILFSQVDTFNMYEATVDIDTSLAGYDATGYMDITVIDTASNENSFTSYFRILSVSDSTDNMIFQGGMNLYVDEANISIQQVGVSLATYSIPFASTSQTLYPVTDMITVRFDVDSSFNEQAAGLNIYYQASEVVGLDETTLGIYKWDMQSKNWELLTDGYVNIGENVASSLISSTGIYAILATAESADSIPPGPINDFGGSTGLGQGEINLSWTAPGDDSIVGTAVNYIIRFNTDSIISDTNWASSTDVPSEPTPGPSGTAESMSVRVPNSDVLYYFAIRTEDEAGNISALSNCISTTSGFTQYTFSLLSPGHNEVLLTLTPRFDWEDARDTSFTDSVLYTLYYGNDSLFHPDSTTLIDSLTESEYQLISPLSDSATFYWKVKAFDTSGTEIWCNQSSGLRFYTTEPTPSIIALEKSSNDILLTWHRITPEVHCNYYIVYRDTLPSYIPGTLDSIGATFHPDTTYIDSNVLGASQNYYYLIKAVDWDGNKSKKSNMGYIFNKFVNENPAAIDKTSTYTDTR